MKVLIAASHIYNNRYEEFTRNKTGFGIVVNNIVSQISKREEVYVITTMTTKGHAKTNHMSETYLKHTIFDVIKYASMKDFIEASKQFFKYPQNIKMRMKYFYYRLNQGYVRKLLSKLKPEIVNIHGISFATIAYIKECEKLKIPYVLTVHGSNGAGTLVGTSNWYNNLEKEVLMKMQIDNKRVICVSNGTKESFINDYKITGKNIEVILNGTNLQPSQTNYLILNKNNIQPTDKVVVVIGNICKLKNQDYIVELWEDLKRFIKCSVKVLFLGNECDGGQLVLKIKEKHLENELIYCGYVKHEDIPKYFSVADLNLILSKSEGFGMSIIEGYACGVPTLTFSDLDAAKELYNDKTMMIIPNREKETFIKYFNDAINTNWDKESILEYGKNFTQDLMISRYIKVYNEEIMKNAK